MTRLEKALLATFYIMMLIICIVFIASIFVHDAIRERKFNRILHERKANISSSGNARER